MLVCVIIAVCRLDGHLKKMTICDLMHSYICKLFLQISWDKTVNTLLISIIIPRISKSAIRKLIASK